MAISLTQAFPVGRGYTLKSKLEKFPSPKRPVVVAVVVVVTAKNLGWDFVM